MVATLDQCEYCRMQISDPRFGGELLTTHGRLLKFDAIECLRDYYRTARAADIRAGWVLDIRHPGSFVSLDSAFFIRATSFHSPMGRGWLATRSDSDAESVVKAIGGGTIVRWTDLQ